MTLVVIKYFLDGLDILILILTVVEAKERERVNVEQQF